MTKSPDIAAGELTERIALDFLQVLSNDTAKKIGEIELAWLAQTIAICKKRYDLTDRFKEKQQQEHDIRFLNTTLTHKVQRKKPRLSPAELDTLRTAIYKILKFQFAFLP